MSDCAVFRILVGAPGVALILPRAPEAQILRAFLIRAVGRDSSAIGNAQVGMIRIVSGF